MGKQIHKKIRSRSGESLAEVLVAMLIISLSTMLLAVMIITAGSIDMAARRRDDTFYGDLTRAETRPAEDAETGETITVTINGSEFDPIPVKIY